MTLERFIEHQRKAIAANFKGRNDVVFTSSARTKQLKSQRRETIRRFVWQLRLATNPVTSDFVADKVKFSIG